MCAALCQMGPQQTLTCVCGLLKLCPSSATVQRVGEQRFWTGVMHSRARLLQLPGRHNKASTGAKRSEAAASLYAPGHPLPAAVL